MYELFDKLFDDSMVFLTSLITLITFLYMVFTALMWISMKKSVDLSKQIYESSNRPFIGIPSINLQFVDKGLLNPSINFSNFGNIPAKQILLRLECLINSELVEFFEISLPNSFPKKSGFWANTVGSKFCKDILNPSDMFTFSFEITYYGITKTKYSTKELYKYDQVSNKFEVIGSVWN